MDSGDATMARGRPVHAVTVFLIAMLITPVSITAQPTPRQIGLGEARTVRSAILNEDRELQIALPETYGRTTISSGRSRRSRSALSTLLNTVWIQLSTTGREAITVAPPAQLVP